MITSRIEDIRERLRKPTLLKHKASPEVAHIVLHDAPYLLDQLDKAIKLLSLAAEFKLNAKWSQDVTAFVHGHGAIESWEPLAR